MAHWIKQIFSPVLSLLLVGCASTFPPLETASHVDLDRFMGDWYVIAYTPTFLDRDAHNAIESYAMNPDGSIRTSYRFREGSFSGPMKEYHPTGYVREGTGNAVWGMQFIWPIKAEYRVAYLKDDYSVTIIGRTARDYVWIMARQPQIPDAELEQLTASLLRQGYRSEQIQRVPQRWDSRPR